MSTTLTPGTEALEFDSVFIRVYELGFKNGMTPVNFEGLAKQIAEIGNLKDEEKKDSMRLWFHQQFMTPIWAHMQFGGSGSPGSAALRRADKDFGIMSGEAVIAYMGYRQYVEAKDNAKKTGEVALKAIRYAKYSLWAVVASTTLLAWVTVWAKEIEEHGWLPTMCKSVHSIATWVEHLLCGCSV